MKLLILVIRANLSSARFFCIWLLCLFLWRGCDQIGVDMVSGLVYTLSVTESSHHCGRRAIIGADLPTVG